MSATKAKKIVAAIKPASVPETTTGGRERLIAAALKLGAEKRSLKGIGVRELGREAGLNPNTFYRHFEDLEDLGVAVLDAFTRDLGPALRSIRLMGLPASVTSAKTVEHVFDYAARNPEAFLVGVRELHGTPTKLRAAMRLRIEDLGLEMVEDIISSKIVPGLDLERLKPMASFIVEFVFHRTLDYLEAPQSRKTLVERTARCIDALLMGAAVLNSNHS